MAPNEATGSHEIKWDSAGKSAEYTLEYSPGLSSPNWRPLPGNISWPISDTSVRLPNLPAHDTAYFRIKIEGADPHQVRWFATEIAPNPKNKSEGYPDPELEVTYDDEFIIVKSNGIPTFEFSATTPNELDEQEFEWEIPRFPEPADEPTQIPLLGTAAITTAGLPIYGPNEAERPDPYGDPYINGLLDFCHGHTGPGGEYHFHFAPTCVIETPDGAEEHYNIIGFALDGYPIIAHYKSVHGKEGAEAFDWQETSGYEPDDEYKEDVLNGIIDSTYVWDHYDYLASRKNRTLDECNGRELTTVKLSDGTSFNEKSFFGFDYAYFVTEEFPYFLAKYRGTPHGVNTGGGGGGRPPGGGGPPPPPGG